MQSKTINFVFYIALWICAQSRILITFPLYPTPSPGCNAVLHGNNPSGTNLGLCEGDCDSDSDCLGTLKCDQGSSGDPNPPGCSGTRYGNFDYCVCQECFGNLEDVDVEATNLGVCQGDCDDYGDCQGSNGGPFLVCHERDSGDPIPAGCSGTANGDWDYCGCYN
eukprot:544154_1